MTGKVLVIMISLAMFAAAGGAAPLNPVVEVEEDVYSYVGANNGAGPLWCSGSTCIVRIGEDVFISGLETLEDFQPLNNVRWLLFKHTAEGWELLRDGGDTHEREPCPLVAFPGGPLFLSVNPNSSKPDQYDSTAQPQVLEFSGDPTDAEYQTLLPKWNRAIDFHGHTYRSFAADGPNREFILLYNTAYDKTYWTFYNSEGEWAAQGEVDFPWGAEYPEPEPVRICYPNVALKDRAVYFCGVSDITEPYPEWRAYKKEITGRDWDYDFRRLFFTWTPDITTTPFAEWVEIASRDKTCGWVFPCDLWVDPAGDVHLLWRERSIDVRLREKFFPDEKLTRALNYAVVREGEVIARQTLAIGGEGESSEMPGQGRFQVTEDDRLFVFYYVSGKDAEGKGISENRVMEMLPDNTHSEPVKVALEHPFTSFMTATWRAGCARSKILDIYGNCTGKGNTMCYARIRLGE